MIEEIEIRGFKSYPTSSIQRVSFTQGVNKISGRNASGKTTLLEAILFSLYGEVPGVNKIDLIPLGSSELSISILLKSPLTGQQIRIHREGSATKDGGFRTTRSLMSVEGEEHPYVRERDIQTRLRELLGIGRNTFLNVVYARQKEFIDILNPNRTRMDAVLGLTTSAEIREQFKEVRRMLETRGKIKERGVFEERIRNTNATIENGQEQIKEIQKRKSNLEGGLKEKKVQLIKLRGRIEDLEIFQNEFSQLDNIQIEIGKFEILKDERQRDLEDVYTSLGENPENVLTDLRASMDGARSTEERLQKIINEELGKDRQRISGEISRLEHQINEHSKFKEQGLTICPKCGQKIDYELIEIDLLGWNKELLIKKSRLKALDVEIRTIQHQAIVARNKWIRTEREIAQMESLMSRLRELKKAIQIVVSQGSELAHKLERDTSIILEKAEINLGSSFFSLEDAKKKVKEELKSASGVLIGLREEVRSREDRITDEERRAKQIRERLEDCRRIFNESQEVLSSILEYESKIVMLEAIQERYREYEIELRENTLTQLEYQTYNYFKRLTDQQLYSACHIDRARYTLEVYQLEGGGKLPAWRTGGGHESLFALAERLALLKVMGFTHLLMLDEPTDAVDSENIPQLLEYVAKSSQEIGQVILVTHHGYGEEEGVNTLIVRKIKGESGVIQNGV